MTATESRSSEHVELEIDGMTCAACAAHVEHALNDLEGATATVNLATERATVAFEPGLVSVEDMLSAVGATGYTAAVADGARSDGDRLTPLTRRLTTAIALTVPTSILAMVPALRPPGWEWLALALSTPVVFWCGWRFHRAAVLSARHRAATMDTLVSLGTLAAWLWSTFVLVAGIDEDTYFEVAAVVTTLILLGRVLEARARSNSAHALRSLLEAGAKDARVLRDGHELVVPVNELGIGDLIAVRPGEKVAADGVVVEGTSAVDLSLLTGEPVPVDVVPGTTLPGGAINAGGYLIVRATQVGADTALAQIARLVAAAQAGKAPVQRLADRVSAVFVPVVIGISVATLVGWLVATGDPSSALTAAVAVLIISCPCALGLATPTALMVGTGRGAQLGIVIRGPEILERAHGITTVVLDKTGTITAGRLELVEIVPAAGVEESAVLRTVGSAEAASEHPVAQAIAAAARERFGALDAVDQLQSRPGLGVEAIVGDRRVVVGRADLLLSLGLSPSPALAERLASAERGGATVVVAAIDDAVAGLFVLADRVKETSAEAVVALTALGLRPVLLTGDNEQTAAAVAAAVGIAEVLAGVLPAGKRDEIARLQDLGERVAMVGDGINDAAALAQADLGVALGTGTDVAIEASDLTLVSGDLRAAADAIRLARRTLRTIKGNLFWAFAYNVAAIPLAVAGLLDPIVAAAAMAFSSLFVVTNSLRLRRFHSIREEI